MNVHHFGLYVITLIKALLFPLGGGSNAASKGYLKQSGLQNENFETNQTDVYGDVQHGSNGISVDRNNQNQLKHKQDKKT